jgi:tetratricopeptide (TPR) repeat protein
MTLAGFTLAGLLLLVSRAEEAPSLPDLPVLKLDDFEPQIRAQIGKALEAARAQPRDAAASGRLGMALHAYEQYEAAGSAYARARQLDAGEPRWHYYHGLVQAALGASEPAIAAFETALRIRPDDIPVALRLADTLLAATHFEESRARYEHLVRGQAALAQARHGLGQIAVATGRAAEGVSHFREALLAFPDYGRAHYALGLALRGQGLAQEAREHLLRSQQLRYREPPLDDPWLREVALLNEAASDVLLQGIVLQSRGQLEAAIAAHERALRLNPALVQAHVNLITLYGRAAREEKAQEHYEAAVRINPDLADGHFNYGLVLEGAGRHSDAADAFRRSLDRNPLNPEAHYRYAAMVEREGRLDEAARHYGEAVDGDPGHRLARFHLGRIFVFQNRFDEAAAQFRQILEPDDENTPRYAYTLGATYARLGQTEEAIRILRFALEKARARRQTPLAESVERDLDRLSPRP